MSKSNKNLSILAELAGVTATIRIGDKELAVNGWTLEQIGQELAATPKLAEAMDGGNVDLSALLAGAPQACARLIARAIGCAADDKAIELAASLPLGSQLLILQRAWDLSFPGEAQGVAQALYAKLTQLAPRRG